MGRRGVTLPPNAKDRTGERHGTYTVLGLAEGRSVDGRLRWHIMCDCGRDRQVSAKYLSDRVPHCRCRVAGTPKKPHHTLRWGTDDECAFIRALGTQSPELHESRPPRAMLIRSYLATLDGRQFPDTVNVDIVRSTAEIELAREETLLR